MTGWRSARGRPTLLKNPRNTRNRPCVYDHYDPSNGENSRNGGRAWVRPSGYFRAGRDAGYEDTLAGSDTLAAFEAAISGAYILAGTSLAVTSAPGTSLVGTLAGDISPEAVSSAAILALAVWRTQTWLDMGSLALQLSVAELPSLTIHSAVADWIDLTASARRKLL
jgi:hypothetical protein